MTTITQSITAFTGLTAPAKTQSSAAFSANLEALVAAMPNLQTQMNTWATQANTMAGELMNGLATVTVAAANITLTAAQELARAIEFTGTQTANITVTVSNNTWPILFKKSTSSSFTITIKTAAGTGKVLQNNGSTALLRANGTNVVCLDRTAAAQLSSNGVGTNLTTIQPTYTKVALGTATLAEGITADTANSRLTVQEPGLYMVTANAYVGAVTTSDNVVLAIYKNGATTGISGLTQLTIGAKDNDTVQISATLALTTNDYIELWGASVVGGTGRINPSAIVPTVLNLVRIR